MTRPNVQSWDPAATNNTDVGGIGLAENIMRPPAVNNALRELMAEVAKFYDDLGGVNTVAGTGDAITVTTASGLTALATGLVLSFRAGANNTTNVTVNVDGLGAKAIRKVTAGEVALIAGDLVAGGKYLLVYDAAANGAAGAWILLNAASSVFSDAAFRVQDNGDATKQLALEVSGLTTGTTRTLTVPDKNGTLILAADAVPGLGMVNGTLVASVNASNLTIAIKTLAGNDPSAGDPVIVAFRDPNPANGNYQVMTLTAATQIVVGASATLGATSGVPFRIWIVGFNDAGTFRMGVVNALSGTSIMPLRDDVIASAGSGSPSAAQVILCASTVTSKAMRILGYAEYSAGLATAGQWNIVPTKLQLFGPGVSKPGDVVQEVGNTTAAFATGTTGIPFDDTVPQNTEGTQFMSQAIVPVAAPNILEVSHIGVYGNGSANSEVAVALFQDSAANALLAQPASKSTGAGTNAVANIKHRLLAGGLSSTTLKIRAGDDGAGTQNTVTFCGRNGARIYGGAMIASLFIKEIMA